MRVRILCLALALACVLGLGSSVMAAQVDCDAIYCFTSLDFSNEEQPLVGICITSLPNAQTGTVMLGNRVLKAGDILTAEQMEQMTFHPLRTELDTQAQVTYLPIYEDRVAPSTTMTIAIRGKEDQAPVAQDLALETYKNLPAEGMLKVSDPEGLALTFTLARQPKRGTVELREDGSFTYTPKKNKVGVDSFVYTAADPAGNVSRQATVTIQILKPTDANQYTDTVGHECRFAAEWMRNTGLFVGETISGESCFYPDKPVSRGQFVAMMVKTLDIPTDVSADTALPEDTPQWLKPYLAAAIRSGLTEGLPETESNSFLSEEPITGAEAAVMLQNALDLSISQQALETASALSEAQPEWAAAALTVMNDHGICLDAEAQMTRGETAQVLYTVSQLAVTAPGTAVFRMD